LTGLSIMVINYIKNNAPDIETLKRRGSMSEKFSVTNFDS